MDIQAMLMVHSDLQKNVAELESKTSEAQKRLRSAAKAIKATVSAGESTGDYLLDLCISCYEDVEGKNKADLETLISMIDQHPGQMVLLICRYENLEGCTGFGGQGHKVLVTEYYLGLQGDTPNLIATERMKGVAGFGHTVGIAVERMALYSTQNRGWKRLTGSIVPPYQIEIWPQLVPVGLSPYEVQARDLALEQGGIYADAKSLPLELICGDEAVETWALKNHAEAMIEEGRSVIGYDKQAPALF